MKKKLLSFIIILLIFIGFSSTGKASRYTENLCSKTEYECIEIEEGQSWSSLWPNPEDVQKIKRLNRTGNRLRKGMKIAVPKNLNSVSKLDLAPLSQKIDSSGSKKIIVDLKQLAWGAYDSNGELLNWGPVSAGKGWCPDIQMKCRTPTGEFTIERKGGASCKSGKFPIPDGGAPTPYCMFFKGGYALHGSYDVPGYHASHGCVRLLVEDAKWLNQQFVEIGTKVTILPY